MEILSISVDRETLNRIESIQKKLGFKSRSKMLRGAMLGMLKDYELLDSLSGNVQSVFVLTYHESEKNHVSDILHNFEDTIKTELHQHHSGTCIDILNINASAKKTKEFFSLLKRTKCVGSVNYSIIPDHS